MDFIEEHNLSTNWLELILKLEVFEKKNYIFRGQSNSLIEKNKINEWKLISSFNRKYSPDFYQFSTYLNQQLKDRLFKSVYSEYSYESVKYLSNCSLIERLYFLQHFGIPTCLLDFTFNPLIAMYFAISEVQNDNGGTADSSGDLVKYGPDCTMNIFALNISRIIEIFNIQEIENEKLMNYRKCFGEDFFYSGYDLQPSKKVKDEKDNYNLGKQKSAFLLFDNKGSSSLGFIDYLQWRINMENIEIHETLVHKFKLGYNAIFKTIETPLGRTKLFYYLQKNKCTGKYLFEDIQGLRTDLNFFH